MRTNSRVDTLDPQRAEAALAVMTVACGVLVRLVDCLCCYLKGILAATVIAFRLLDDLLVTRVRDGSAFYSGHVLISS